MAGELEADALTNGGARSFFYEEAFSRNLGLVTEWEQQILRSKRVAIAGMGGVGGVHLLTMARFGIGSFNITDFDHFELANFNRQVGAGMDTIGRPKVEVLAERALQINPELKLKTFGNGLSESNLEEFLDGVDLYIDSLDFFVLDIRRKLYARCAELGIPVVCAAPLGMGTAYLVFKPGGMTFEEWFQLDGLSEEDQFLNWYVGLAPSRLQTSALVDPSRVDFTGRRGPSTVAGCELSAGVASVEGVKLLLGRGVVRAVPYYHQFDVYKGKFVVKKMRGGNRAPMQRLKIVLARQLLKTLKRQEIRAPKSRAPETVLEKILDIARWAPSGDNCQPWRFEIVDPARLIIHIEGSGDIYDFNDGEPTLLAAGFLLETLRIAASSQSRRIAWSYLGKIGAVHRVAVDLQTDDNLQPDSLLTFVPLRSVDRAAYRRSPLTIKEKAALASALGDGLAIEWHEALSERWRVALSNARTTDIRLRTFEAFTVHQRVIDWTRKYSPVGLPSGALGIDRLTLKPMRWVMGNWRRMKAMNRIAGTGFVRLEMDLIPGIFCAAHFTIRKTGADVQSSSPEALLATGEALQRFWLTATKLGLALQPALALRCFELYGREKTAFTADSRLLEKAERLAAQLKIEKGGSMEDVIFCGRIGQPKRRLTKTRSIRRDQDDLILDQAEASVTAESDHHYASYAAQ